MDQYMTRSRTYAWEDPTRAVAAAATMSGLEIVQALMTGELPAPPMIQTAGLQLAEVAPGRVVLTAKAAEYMYNPLGSVHGGLLATMLDTAAGCAVHTRLPVGVRYTSLDLSVKFLRAMTTESGAVRCVGTVTHLGRRTALAEARVTDENERLLATATSSCLILGKP
jgi:uncharacterized protein (TIGR00369 family)